MSPDRAGQTYQCQCRGCTSGGSFEAAAEEWWRGKGLTPPRNCPSCREWIKEQADEKADCEACGWQIPVSAKRKIFFHKREGRWNPPKTCSRCESDPTWAQHAAQARRSIRSKRAEKKCDRRKPSLVKTLERNGAFPTQLSGIELSSDLSWWETTFTEYRKEGLQSLYVHVVSRHGDQIANATGLTTDREIVQYLSTLAKADDSSRFVEFRQNESAIVKLDTMTRVAMIVDLRFPSLPKPITAFPPDADSAIVQRLRDGRWKV